MPRRSKLGIIAEILEVLAKGPIGPTRLATLANMSYDRLRGILEDLEERGIVSITSTGKSAVVELTPKGYQLLRELRRLRRVLEDFGLAL